MRLRHTIAMAAGLCRLLLAVAILGCTLGSARAETPPSVKYFILTGTMEPLMIQTAEDPMAGGMFTDIVKAVFGDSAYAVEPMVMPWQRMTGELRQRDDWIMHGIPAFFEPDIPYRLSEVPVFPFNHVAVTLRDSHVAVKRVEDLFGRSVILVENYHYPGLDPYLDDPLVGKGSGKIQAVRAFKPGGTLKMLKHRRGEVAIGFQPRILYHMAAAGLTLDDVVVQDVSNIIPTQPMFVAYSPGFPAEFGQFLNSRLATMRDSGELTAILKPYYGPIGVPQ